MEAVRGMAGMEYYSGASGTGFMDPSAMESPAARLALVPAVPSGVERSIRAGTYFIWVKPAIDIAIALVLLVVLLPLILMVALAVRVHLGSGVIYRQQRIGQHGRPFWMLKFRTMAPDRREGSRPFEQEDRRMCHKRDDDPRHTRVGRFLRKSSLDELPQLLHVITGQMSLVGPRPELVEVVERHYEPWQHARHEVKPGITGFWQVSGRGSGLAHEGVDLDLAYIDQLSFRTDCRVLVDTVLVIARKTGS